MSWTEQQLRSLGAELYSLGAKSPTNKLKGELDSAKTLITWSKKNSETSRKYAKLSSLEAKESENKLKILYPLGRTEKRAGQHKLSSLGQGPTMSPGGQRSAVISAGVLHAALTCLLRAALTCPIRAPRACAVLDCWRHGIAWQRSPVRCLLPCIHALREKESFQLFHFVQPLKMVHLLFATVRPGPNERSSLLR